MKSIIICGSRDFNDYSLLKNCMDDLITVYNDDIEIVSGCARGADTLGERYAKENNIPVKRFPAEWDNYGRSAGPIRNKQMIDYANLNKGICVAFWDGKSHGTRFSIDYAKEVGLPVEVFKYKTSNLSRELKLYEDNNFFVYSDLVEGVSRDETGEYVFNFDSDSDDDFIKFDLSKVEITTLLGTDNKYYYSYKVDKNNEDYRKFLRYLKANLELKNVKRFLDNIVRDFVNSFNEEDVGCIVIPESSSYMNKYIAESIADSLNINIAVFKKNTPANIKFNWDAFNNSNPSSKRYKNVKKAVKKMNSSDYFSLSKIMPIYAREYVQDFLIIDNSNIDMILESSSIIIFDDIITQGTSIKQICEKIRKIGYTGEFIIMSVFNNMN